MIKIENTEVFGWKMAIAGCRNPMNSRLKSDTLWIDSEEGVYQTLEGNQGPFYHFNDKEMMKEYNVEDFILSGMYIGPADHKLLMNLCKGGTEESKWRRMIHVQMDVTAPLYWWKEFETYKVGTVSNSCSTMHKIHAKEFTLDDFSCEHLFDHDDIDWPEDFDADHPYNIAGIPVIVRGFDDKYHDLYFSPKGVLDLQIEMLNKCRDLFLSTKDKKYWWQMIQLLPSSYNQRRTIDLNYEVLASQYRQRKEHKLDEWRRYCDWIRKLPYSEFITMEETDV